MVGDKRKNSDSDRSDGRTNKRPEIYNEFHNEDPLDERPSSPISTQGTPTSVLTKQVSKTSDGADICPLGNTAKQSDRGSSKGNKAIQASLDMNNEEYILKLTSVPIDNAKAEQALTAAVLLSQGEILRKLGKKLLSQIGASYSFRSRL